MMEKERDIREALKRIRGAQLSKLSLGQKNVFDQNLAQLFVALECHKNVSDKLEMDMIREGKTHRHL
jgi:hypothetical protein